LNGISDLDRLADSRGAAVDEGPGDRISVRGASWSAWWSLGVLSVFYALSSADRMALSSLAEAVKRDLQLTDTQMSLALGPAFLVTYCLFGIAFGWAADRYPRRWIIYVGAMVWSAATVGTGLVRTAGALFAARAAVAIGEATLTPCAMTLISEKFPRNRLALAMSIYQCAFPLGTAAAFATVGWIVGHAQWIKSIFPLLDALKPWELCFILMGVSGVGLALFTFTLSDSRTSYRPGSAVKTQEAADGLLAFLVKERRLLLPLMLGVNCIGVIAGALQAWTPAYLERRFGWSPVEFGPYLSVVALIAGLSLLVKGGVMDWLFARGLKDAYLRLYTWLLIGSTPAVCLLFVTQTPVLFILLYAVVWIFVTPIAVFLMPVLRLVSPPPIRGRVVGLSLLWMNAGFAIGPVLTGLFTDYIIRDSQKIGLSLGIILCAFFAIAVILFRVSLPHLRRATPSTG
jgi:MFS family permease